MTQHNLVEIVNCDYIKCSVLIATDTTFNRPLQLRSNGLISSSIIVDSSIEYNSMLTKTDDPNPLGTHPHSLTITLGSESDGGRDLSFERFNTKNPDFLHTIPSVYATFSKVTSKTPQPQILPGASLNAPLLFNNVIVESTVQSCPSLKNVTLQPFCFISASTLQDVIFQSSVSVSSSSIIRALAMSHSHIAHHAIVIDCVLGPDAHLSCCETHCSLLGPFSSQHHQSLHISCLNPNGRTNLGYGGNCGSNHTGRLPDQEAWLGEGVFYGLSTSIKFPLDLSNSPYSIIATSTVVNPCTIKYPFSLITSDSNVTFVRPGWVLSSSPYTVRRASVKFKTRGKATSHKWYASGDVFRSGIVEMMRNARIELLRIKSGAAESEGGFAQGAKVVDVEKGVRGYTDYIRLYVLKGLLDRILSDDRSVPCAVGGGTNDPGFNSKGDEFMWNEPESQWPYQSWLLGEEFPTNKNKILTSNDVDSLLNVLVTLHLKYYEKVRSSKEKDDRKGRNVKLYSEIHTPAGEDKVVKGLEKEHFEIVRMCREARRKYTVNKL
ncbi:hypothetical protein TrVE_jg9804 [Triparma verrucosa]|uniref:Uncharacterized protein n=1 Tax=Triparma verrucosa TaxID=1606542 RepID=A0A9W7C1N6_9STRA|nr:hypothetical protein TrVE_jg9804 [Triparma verrucosa]